MRSLIALFQGIGRDFRPADFLDIAFISFFIYSVITWFKRTASRSVVIGIGILTLLYFIARRLEMYLTALVFQTVFAVFLIAVVVVFQEEIRRGFERVALWGRFRGRWQAARFGGVDALMEGISTLASNRIGALLVIKGREPLDRHAEGGIPLDGRISKPLLYSIFDPHSPGHDGAALLEGDRVTKFGAHLPLSKNLAQVGMLGTRHAAALGMSECSDAFVVVVSEERGTISVAQEGRLRPVGSVAELKGLLERFFAERFPHETEPDWKRLLKENARVKVFAVGLACVSWYLFAYQVETIQRTFVAPIEYRNQPQGMHLEGRKPVEARVTLSGSERAFDLLNPSSLLISLDLGSLREGYQRIGITEESLRKPSNLSVYRMDPDTVRVEAYRVTSVSVPVRVQTIGAIQPPARLAGIKVLPATVRLKVRGDLQKDLQAVFTEPLDLNPIRQTTLLRVNLLVPEQAQLVEPEAPEVHVTVEVTGAEPQEAQPKG